MEEENVDDNDLDLIENENKETDEISDDEEYYFKEYELFYQEIITVFNELKTENQDTNALITRIKSNFDENECDVENGELKNEDPTRNFKKEVEKTIAFEESLEQMESDVMKNSKETLELQIQLRNDLLEIVNDEQDLQHENQELLKNTNCFFNLCKEFQENCKKSSEEMVVDENETKIIENKIIKKNIQKDSKRKEEEKEEQIKADNNSSKNEKKHFIERNIELSGNGLGTLSMTDKEHDRIVNLVQEKDEEILKNKSNMLYDMEQISSELKEIDFKLKKLNEISPTYKNDEKNTFNENWKDEIKLQEINKMIEESSQTDKVVEPANEKKMAELTALSETESKNIIKASNDQIKELIEDSEKMMPHFKFKYSKKNIQEMQKNPD